MEESEIKAIKLILTVLALGLLVAVGAAFGGQDGYPHHGNPSDGYDLHDFGGFYDWLSPGAYYYTYSYYPTYTYYPTYYYPAYYYQTYSPVYTYTAPVVTTPVVTTPVVTTPVVYYDPVVYDPWWAVNVYGLGSTTYYYSSSWSWSSYHGGMFFR